MALGLWPPWDAPRGCVFLQAQLKETKGYIVVEKVKLATLIYTDTCRNHDLEVLPLSPVETPWRADQNQKNILDSHALGSVDGNL